MWHDPISFILKIQFFSIYLHSKQFQIRAGSMWKVSLPIQTMRVIEWTSSLRNIYSHKAAVETHEKYVWIDVRSLGLLQFKLRNVLSGMAKRCILVYICSEACVFSNAVHSNIALI